MRYRGRAGARIPNSDTEFYTCPYCNYPDLTSAERGTHDLQGRKLYQCPNAVGSPQILC